MRSIQKKLAITLLSLLLFLPAVASADSTVTPPAGWSESYKKTSPDGRYVLVMLNGSYSENSGASPEYEELNKLLLKYPASGLYLNDGSIEPIWKMPYVSWRQGVTLSSDGRHVVVWGGWPWASGTYAEHAFSIYEDGHELARYTVRELVSYPEELPHTASHYEWLSDSSIGDARGVLVVRTLHGEEYTYSLFTGKFANGTVSTAVVRSKSSAHTVTEAAAVTTAVTKWAAKPASPEGEEASRSLLSLGMSAGSLILVFLFVQLLSSTKSRGRNRPR